MELLQVSNLYKKFNSFVAVDNISFSLKKGQVLGLLGPNGAGKTTTIHMLLGLILPGGGTIQYFGHDFFKNRQYCLQKINYTSAYNNLQKRITVWENLLVYANLYGLKDPKKKIMELINYFESSYLLSQRFQDLSSGQRTRINIIKSLLNDPEIVLMDEPTASLDPDVTDKTLVLIEELKKSRNLSILYTSHNMQEITRICDEVIFLDHGKIVAQDTPINLTKQIPTAQLRLVFEGDKTLLEKLLAEQGQGFSFESENIIVINTEEKLIPKLIFKISKIGIFLTDIEVKKPTLEDVFLQIARGEKYVAKD